MAALIEWHTVGEIFIESVLAGVVIVGAFALGARLLAGASTAGGSTADPAARSAGGGRRTAGYALAALCFLIAAVAVGYGVYFTIDK